MILHMYAYYNKLGEFYGTPFVDKAVPDDFAKDFIQGLVGLSIEHLSTLIEDDLYYLGTFDNVSGEIKFEKKFLAHLSETCTSLIEKKKGVKDGSSEQVN